MTIIGWHIRRRHATIASPIDVFDASLDAKPVDPACR
jgi:hypothetical protein